MFDVFLGDRSVIGRDEKEEIPLHFRGDGDLGSIAMSKYFNFLKKKRKRLSGCMGSPLWVGFHPFGCIRRTFLLYTKKIWKTVLS